MASIEKSGENEGNIFHKQSLPSGEEKSAVMCNITDRATHSTWTEKHCVEEEGEEGGKEARRSDLKRADSVWCVNHPGWLASVGAGHFSHTERSPTPGRSKHERLENSPARAGRWCKQSTLLPQVGPKAPTPTVTRSRRALLGENSESAYGNKSFPS